MDAGYNDIQPWTHTLLPQVFGGTSSNTKTHVVKTKDEVDTLFKNEAFNKAEVLQIVEIHIPKKDAPRALVLTAEASAKVNSKQ